MESISALREALGDCVFCIRMDESVAKGKPILGVRDYVHADNGMVNAVDGVPTCKGLYYRSLELLTEDSPIPLASKDEALEPER